jgi:NAD(P)-dependent dehydrogenase (short-subunit alcohol dehydrogenase family)
VLAAYVGLWKYRFAFGSTPFPIMTLTIDRIIEFGASYGIRGKQQRQGSIDLFTELLSRRVFQSVASEDGRLDILVNAAGGATVDRAVTTARVETFVPGE